MFKRLRMRAVMELTPREAETLADSTAIPFISLFRLMVTTQEKRKVQT